MSGADRPERIVHVCLLLLSLHHISAEYATGGISGIFKEI
jgi:hypothetical protein